MPTARHTRGRVEALEALLLMLAVWAMVPAVSLLVERRIVDPALGAPAACLAATAVVAAELS